MKFILTVIGIGISSFFLTTFGPWWLGIIPAAIGVILVHFKSSKAFLSGFLGVGLAWLVEAIVIDVQNHGILSEKISVLFSSAPIWALFGITFIIGGLIGGLGSITASAGVKWIVTK